MVTKHMIDVGKVSDQNTQTVTAVIDDWNILPFTSVTVTDVQCPAGTETMFNRHWGGTDSGCLVNKQGTGNSGSQSIMTQSEYDAYVRNKASSSNSGLSITQVKALEKCEPISALEAKAQDKFWDVTFCGTRAGNSFVNAVRPYPQGDDVYECPKGYAACS